ncbi:MAG TPA: DUF4145 domain-containing protein [Candidatus Saccharimonadales bacterium]|nr:DUF4145 domain-containing protein [Candidatus Saccharimonadales bacterium]
MRDGSASRVEVERVTVLECGRCHQGTLVVEGRPLAAGSWRGTHWWPPNSAAAASAATPAPIADAFGEGLRALSTNAPRAAAVMFRGTLETIVRELGSAAAQKTLKDKDLKSALQTMVDEHALTPGIGEWATEIRGAGNAGAHVNPLDPVTQDEAVNLSKLAAAIIEYLYEQPARLRRSRGLPPTP